MCVVRGQQCAATSAPGEGLHNMWGEGGNKLHTLLEGGYFYNRHGLRASGHVLTQWLRHTITITKHSLAFEPGQHVPYRRLPWNAAVQLLSTATSRLNCRHVVRLTFG